MSNVTYLDAGNASRRRGQNRTPRTVRPRPCAHARELQGGVWIVHDEFDRKGGCFRDRAAAFKFVEDEFGPDAVTVIHPRFSTPAQRRRSPTSIALRAVTAR